MPARKAASRRAPVVHYAHVASPAGRLRLVERGGALVRIDFADAPGTPAPRAEWKHAPARLRAARRQLAAYFAGRLRRFRLSLAPEGSPFQRRVWAALGRIPYGSTITYAELARRAGRPAAVRAAGAANGRNPLAIVVPCHRVVGSDGRLTGYGGGLAAKAALLALERRGAAAAVPPRPRR